MRYGASSHTPRSTSRQVSEQNGRYGLPCQKVRVRQVGHVTPRSRGRRATASWSIVAASYRPPTKPVNSRTLSSRAGGFALTVLDADRKSTRLNSSHLVIS